MPKHVSDTDTRLSLPSRATATSTTGTLAADATETTAITLRKGYRLYKVETNRPARVRLYATASQRDADVGRARGTDPTGDHGLVLDYVTTATQLSAALAPAVSGVNMEAVPSTAIPMTVTNLDTVAGTVTVTLTYAPTE